MSIFIFLKNIGVLFESAFSPFSPFSIFLKKTSEVEDHLLVNHNHDITWQVRAKAPAQTFKRKILEAFYIKPMLNSQKDTKSTHLFRNGIK